MDLGVVEVYQDFVWKGGSAELAERLYDIPVLTMGGFVERAPSIVDTYAKIGWHTDERIETLQRALEDLNRHLDCLTPKVKSAIERIPEGVIEASHQSVVLGGPCYILNKAASTRKLSTIGHEKGIDLSPIFFVADYDIVQPELTNIRTPAAGQGGNLVSLPIQEGYEHSPVHAIPLPDNDWYSQVEEGIRAGYRPLFKALSGNGYTLFEERLEHCLALARSAYVNSRALGEWAQRILAQLFNIEQNLGIPLVPASDPRIRQLMSAGMQFLVARSNRALFLQAHEAAMNLITENGFRPGMGSRGADYVPFYFECQNDSCHSSRTELHYAERGSKIGLTGQCASCGDKVDIELDADDPDLSEVAGYLSPRVDSRQLIMDFVLPIIVHIGGMGEAAYYAQVIPAAKALDVPFPLFVKYPRAYFNTPWDEQLAGSLKARELPVLHSPKLFSLLGKLAKLRSKRRFDEMNSALWELAELVTTTRDTLNEELARVKESVSHSSQEDASKMLETRFQLERYLSWSLGEFAEEKTGQESAWSWIEWAINSGFPDLFGPYERAYFDEMKNGATFFVNFSIREGETRETR
jgi:uncharacterized protein YllA (UPF0747 family)